MKIVLALEHFDPRRGGLEHWTWQFARQLAEASHEVHIVSCGFAEPPGGAALQFHEATPSPSPLQRAAAIEQTVRALSADVVHDMGCGWHADIFHPHGGSGVAFRDYNLMRIPKWRQFRLWREKRYREQERVEKRQHANTAACVVAVSEMVRGHFRTIHRLPAERIRLIPNGVDIERFSPEHRSTWRAATRRSLSCSDDETLFLLVAHNLRLKNAEAAVRALARLNQDGAAVRLAVVGGKKPQPFQRLAQKLSVEDRVHFIDSIDDVRPYYAAADVHLHPTWYDPCSLVALEALASGLPLITTRFNGVSEFMDDAIQGFLLPNPADVGALAARMRLLLDRGQRDTMGNAARRLAMNHTFAQQTREFLALYREIAERKNRGGRRP